MPHFEQNNELSANLLPQFVQNLLLVLFVLLFVNTILSWLLLGIPIYWLLSNASIAKNIGFKNIKPIAKPSLLSNALANLIYDKMANAIVINTPILC